ncbi:TRAP transporter small permease [Brevibacillus choshinensis]|uniref:TRAP transporter small permease n=1 Tax=Brevibacillus choshinensis TaxID=54911 RepID=UPI002E1BBE9F|nr:TRAP transporter small permease [Brevibacillus choshinensis]MED4782872.1 TRAP transporter small permease [Brevibacillus choshinensis]
MNTIQRTSDFIYRIEKVLAVVILCIMTLSLVAGVVFRYFLNSPLSWSDEAAMFSLVWVTFLGGSICIKRDQLAAVSFVTDRFSGKTRQVLLSLGLFIVILFCLFFLYLSLNWITSPTMSFERSDALELPMIIPYSIVPIGTCFMTIHFIHTFLHGLRIGKTEGEDFT